jgi:hypothetical protein
MFMGSLVVSAAEIHSSAERSGPEVNTRSTDARQARPSSAVREDLSPFGPVGLSLSKTEQNQTRRSLSIRAGGYLPMLIVSVLNAILVVCLLVWAAREK